MSKLPYSYPSLNAQGSLFALGQEVARMFQRVAKAFNEPDHGPTAERPTRDLTPAQQFFDTTLNRPIWWDAVNVQWVDATGTPV